MKATMLILLLGLVACASRQTIISDFAKGRGYASEDTKLIDTYYQKYANMYSGAFAASNGFDSSKQQGARGRLFRLYCNCEKKLGGKCLTKHKGLTKDQKRIWAKGNAAYLVQERMGNSIILGTGGDMPFDKDEC